ncbi:conserved hypothetical protein [Vibrio chagasii]|nr:conserved hypothetical protein [Vibrio chagasii]CAH6973801.1 conserved hypothetical protein [Vibrio chagasii]CAH7227293.1 conserved hypothetical protein [Vibrio chagasii]
MSFNFDELLNQGKEAANLVTQNNREIKEVFTKLNTSLSRFLEVEIQFLEEIEYEDDGKAAILRAVSMFEPRVKTGYNNISIKHEETNVKRHFMSVKRSSEGYPITVVHEKNHYVADNQDEFAQAVGTVVSNSQTHLMFRGFKRAIDKAIEESQNKGE